MTKEQESSKENPAMFWMVGVAVAGIIGYKLVLDTGINTIITMVINVGIACLGVTLLMFVLIFSIRDFAEQKESIFSNNKVRIFYYNLFSNASI